MSWRDAPLYIEAHDLARYLLERTSRWEGALGPRVATTACELVEAVALALTFPARRAAALEAADEAIARLRCQLRLAHELGGLSAGALRHAGGRLQACGRMVGGWRKRVGVPDSHDRKGEHGQPLRPGDGPQAAAGA